MVAFHEDAEPIALAVLAAHRVGVEAQRERRISAAYLLHDVGRIVPHGDQDRSERVAQLVRARPSGSVPRSSRSRLALARLTAGLKTRSRTLLIVLALPRSGVSRNFLLSDESVGSGVGKVCVSQGPS